MPGGIREMFYGTEVEQIFLKSRFGFAKLALTTGASLVPAYCLGANQCYTRYSNQHSLLAKVSSKIQTSLVFWTGAFGIPVRVKCTIQLTLQLTVAKCVKDHMNFFIYLTPHTSHLHPSHLTPSHLTPSHLTPSRLWTRHLPLKP